MWSRHVRSRSSTGGGAAPSAATGQQDATSGDRLGNPDGWPAALGDAYWITRPSGGDVAESRHLFIAETGEYRIWKVDLAARGLDARSALASTDAHARVIAANLPGFPDNLTRSADGRLWTGLTKPRAAAIDRMASKPWLRAVTFRLPKAMWPVPPTYGHVIAFDEDGRVVADLQDPAGHLAETSGVTEHGGRLYIHSLHAGALGVLDTPAAADSAARAFAQALPLLANLGAQEASLARIARELKKTQRRCNALSKKVIPDCRQTLAFLSGALEERERE
ncbi:hypothetical protein HGA89_07120, partial [bacterium]|nr:hypothetical protein [bacterium]